MNEVTELSTLDTLIDIAGEPNTRPLDFALILQLRNPPCVRSLRTAALSARTLFPTTNSALCKGQWIPFGATEPETEIPVLSADLDEDSSELIEAFVDRPLDPKQQQPVQQLLIVDEKHGLTKVVTRFHHVVADGVSAAMWLGHQLRVAYGLNTQDSSNQLHGKLTLRRHSSPVRKSVYAYGGAACALWSSGYKRSHKRRWTTFHFSAARLREHCRRAGGFTYNDLLATCLLEVFSRWNSEHSCRRAVSLWLPINIRQKPLEGFGNGTSRIRIYARYQDSLSLKEKCREVRKQIAWSIRNGEWAVPGKLPLERWLWATRPLIRGYLNRPLVDMCTSVFSHVERLGRCDELVFQNVEELECVGLLHKQHSLAVNGATQGGRTWLTFTYDPHLLTAMDIQRLIEMYQEQIATAF